MFEYEAVIRSFLPDKPTPLPATECFVQPFALRDSQSIFDLSLMVLKLSA